MKSFIKSIIRFIIQTLRMALFLLRMVWHGTYSNPFKTSYKGTVAVLANGPSLKEVIPTLQTDPAFQDVDYIVMNYFAFEEVFFQIKPKHYCLADPMFFGETHRKEEALRLFALFQQKVDWPLNIYIPASELKKFKTFSQLDNPHIHIVPLCTIDYTGYERFRFYFYKHSVSMPCPQTVANMCIFVAINVGYSQVNLYGVDHTFFDSLCVDDQNRLCNRDTHFYDNGTPSLKPIQRIDSGKVWKIGDYLIAIAKMFKSHDLLAAYAQYRNVKIVNCTKGSMIDSYERKS